LLRHAEVFSTNLPYAGFLFRSVTQAWKEQAKVEEARQRAAIAALPEKELRQAVRLQDAIDRRREQQRERQGARLKGPSPGM
jgi:hypothetical protein